MAHSSGGRLAGRPAWVKPINNRKNAPFHFSTPIGPRPILFVIIIGPIVVGVRLTKRTGRLNPNPVGLGGWLIYFGISLCGAVLMILYELANASQPVERVIT